MEDAVEVQVIAGQKRRFRVGLRTLMIIVLALALALGWFAWQDRLAREQTDQLAELRGMGVYVNEPYPTPFCWMAMRFLGNSQQAEIRLSRWLDPGWFTRPRGFNAGFLKDDRVAVVVARLERYGSVKEVRFDRPPLTGLRLFYIDRIPYERLGVPKDACTFTDHPRMASHSTRVVP